MLKQLGRELARQANRGFATGGPGYYATEYDYRVRELHDNEELRGRSIVGKSSEGVPLVVEMQEHQVWRSRSPQEWAELHKGQTMWNWWTKTGAYKGWRQPSEEESE